MDLTSLSQTARKLVILFVVGVIALIIIYIVFRVSVSVIRNLTPEPPPVANQLFGNLAPIKFENPVTDTTKFTFSLETVDSQLPATPFLFKVYQLKQPPSLFQGLEQAKKRATEFSFKTEPVALSSSLYQFRDSGRLGFTYSLDVISGDYHLILDPSLRSDLLVGRLTFDSNEAITRAKNYMRNHSSLTKSFEDGEAQVRFLNITPRQTARVNSPDQANAFRVDFYPSPLEENYRILTQRPDSSPINITMLANGKSDEGIFEINYEQFEIDFDNQATYNIKDSTIAWEELKNGQGVVIKSTKPTGPIAITNISLGYFMEKGSRFLKPVYIFEGTSSVDQLEPDFLAVLPAIAVENKAK